MSYINRDDAIAYPLSWDHYDKKNGNRHFIAGVESYREYVEDLPTADVVEVVRCKDCKFLDKYHACTVQFGQYFPVTKNSYCSFGEGRHMSRYIDADKLQEAFKELHGGKRSLLIDTEPTADVAEVVRCKDCKYYMPMLTTMGCGKGLERVRMNDYCSYGERAEA